MVLVPWAKKHHMENNVDVFRVNKIAIPKNREVSRMNNELAYSPSCPCFSKTESISQLVFRCNHVNTNSEILVASYIINDRIPKISVVNIDRAALMF